MEKLIKAANFVFKNRRIIGVITGSTLTLFGFSDIGTFATKVGEM